jgi:hypothetical protein
MDQLWCAIEQFGAQWSNLLSDGATLIPAVQHWCTIEQSLVYDMTILVPNREILVRGDTLVPRNATLVLNRENFMSMRQLWFPTVQYWCLGQFGHPTMQF